MKIRIFTIVWLCVWAWLWVQPVAAQQADAEIDWQTAASYMPDDIEIFGVLRTDAHFFEQLDSLSETISRNLDMEDSLDFNGLLGILVTGNPDSSPLVLVRPFLGDYVAFGISHLTDGLDTDRDTSEPAAIYLVMQTLDSNSFLQSIIANALGFGDIEPQTLGEHTVYVSEAEQKALAFADKTVIAVQGSTDLLNFSKTFADVDKLSANLKEMPLDSYEGLLYVDTAAFFNIISEPILKDFLQALGIENAESLLLGLGVTEAQSLVLDMAITGTDIKPERTLNPDFLSYIPENAQFVLHSVAPSDLVHTATAVYASISEIDTPESVIEQLDAITQQLFNLELEAEILAWASSDYTLVINPQESGTSVDRTTPPLDFGLYIEIDNAAHAVMLKEGAANAAEPFLESMENFRSRELQIIPPENGRFTSLDVTNVMFDIPNAGSWDVVIGTMENLLFIGSRDLIVQGLSNSQPIQETDGYLNATRDLLPNASATLYVSNEGVGKLIGLIPALKERLNTNGIIPNFAAISQGGSISFRATESGTLQLRLALSFSES